MLDGFYVAKFEKVSLEQFKKDMHEHIKDNVQRYGITVHYHELVMMNNDGYSTKVTDESFDKFCESIYQNIKLPTRATHKSAGYDFFIPFGLILRRKQDIIIPTGIRCSMLDGYSLDIYPKSGLGFKYNLKICNTIGIVDADYYDSSNEGHIMVKLENVGYSRILLGESPHIDFPEGKSFVQGIFHEVFQASNDEDNTELKTRDGGFGSTN